VNRLIKTAAFVLAVIVAAGPAPAQDPRVEPPKSPAEWFSALEFELNTGQYDAGLFYLRGFLASSPTDKDLVAIERDRGFASFLRLRAIRWSNDPKIDAEGRQLAEQAIERVNAAVRRELGDPQRIARYIQNLGASPEERSYAITELQRSGALAMPQIIATLRQETDPYRLTLILNVLPALPADTVQPLLVALVDIPESSVLKIQLLRSLGARRDLGQLPARVETDPLPTLEFLAASPRQANDVRRAAADLASRLLAVAPSRLPIAKAELTRFADRFYRHEAAFINPNAVPVWRWEDNRLAAYAATASQAEEFFGLRYARWALELDSSYEPAQVVFLSIATDKAMERGGLEQPLAQIAPDVHDLLATVYAGALINTLDRAVAEKRTAVALGITRVLGERSEIQAARSERNRPGVLVRALDYPDRRVQLAAADALLRLPGPPVHQAMARVVEVLRRAVAADSETSLPAAPLRVLVANFVPQRAAQMADAVRAAGYEVVVVRTGREIMRRLNEASDIDAVIVDSEIPFPPLEDTLASLRYDVHAGMLPVRILYQPTAPGTTTYTANGRLVTVNLPAGATESVNVRTEARLNRLIESYRQVSVVRGPLSGDLVKQELTQPSPTEPPAPSPPLTPAERKGQSLVAMKWLDRLAACPHMGYDVRPAERAIRQAIIVPELSKLAIDATSRLPGRDAQIDLANTVLNPQLPADVRILAADGLIRHVQLHGNGLGPQLTQTLISALPTFQDPALRTRAAAAVGAVYGNPEQSGLRMERYQAPLPRAPAPAATTPPAEPAPKPMEPAPDK
jgi:CheY-like chemotaxis protein